MKKDLISKQAVIEAIEEMSFTMSKCLTVDEYHGMNRAKQFILEQIKLLPSTGKDTRMGRWIPIKPLLTAARCSECKSAFAERTNYCPRCGAKMKGETE